MADEKRHTCWDRCWRSFSCVWWLFHGLSRLCRARNEGHSTSLAEKLKLRSGIIVPFYGTEADAESLAKDGWIICDGRTVVDDKASSDFIGQPTPNLVGQFLMGGKKSGKTGGAISSKSTEEGDGSHSRRQISGSGFGDDNSNNQFLTSPAGGHRHSVKTVHLYTTVIYLIYVR